PGRQRRLLDAVVALLFAGDLAEAAALLDGAPDCADTALLRFAHGYQAWTRGDIGRAERNLLLAWQRCEDATDPQTAARAAQILSNLCLYLGRGSDAITWARRSLDANPCPDAAAHPRGSMLLGYGLSRPAAEGLAVAGDFEVSGAPPAHVDGLLVGRGTVKLWADDPAGARADLLTVAERCLRAGPLEHGMFAAVHLADAEWRLGCGTNRYCTVKRRSASRKTLPTSGFCLRHMPSRRFP
ncbi:MAG: hypothetical protein ACRDR6_14040, partial [Pseudonocardiaceae bacterium]